MGRGGWIERETKWGKRDREGREGKREGFKGDRMRERGRGKEGGWKRREEMNDGREEREKKRKGRVRREIVREMEIASGGEKDIWGGKGELEKERGKEKWEREEKRGSKLPGMYVVFSSNSTAKKKPQHISVL